MYYKFIIYKIIIRKIIMIHNSRTLSGVHYGRTQPRCWRHQRPTHSGSAYNYYYYHRILVVDSIDLTADQK